MMIGRGGAAGQQQFRHRHRDPEVERLRRQPRPYRIERLQPGKQLAVQRRRQRPGQRLVEVMMGVDQARQHHMVARLEECRRCRRLAAFGHQFDDPALLDYDPALGAFGEDGQRVLDPDRPCLVHGLSHLQCVRNARSDANPAIQGPAGIHSTWRRSCKTSYKDRHRVESTSLSMDLNTIKEVARPRSRDQLPVWAAGDAWLAGGTWLFSEPQVHLTRLIDLTDFEWPALTVSETSLTVAATCTVAQLDAF